MLDVCDCPPGKKKFKKMGQQFTITDPEKIRPIEKQILDEALVLAWAIWDAKLQTNYNTSKLQQLIIKYQESKIYKWRYRNHGKRM